MLSKSHSLPTWVLYKEGEGIKQKYFYGKYTEQGLLCLEKATVLVQQGA